MQGKKWRIALLCIPLALLGLDSVVFAVDDEFSRRTLRGLSGVQVVVEPLYPEIERDGLTTQQLQTDTELKLRLAGIRLLSPEQRILTPGSPYLYVFPHIIKRELPRGYACNLMVEVCQEVSLIRAPNIKEDATTWSIASLGFGSDLNHVRPMLKDLIDIFINAYLSVNQK